MTFFFQKPEDHRRFKDFSLINPRYREKTGDFQNTEKCNQKLESRHEKHNHILLRGLLNGTVLAFRSIKHLIVLLAQTVYCSVHYSTSSLAREKKEEYLWNSENNVTLAQTKKFFF